jgi:hemerythrin-like domain-containing protein
MTDLFSVLRADHQQALRLAIQLEEGVSGPRGATPPQLELRRELVERLIMLESQHEVAEEIVFWPAVRERVPGGDQLAVHGVGQESATKPALNRMSKIGPRHSAFEPLLTQVLESLREHIDFEQETVWPALSAQLSAAQAAELGEQFTSAKAAAPTRPHPHTPGVPGILKRVGAAAALADRARDAATSRGDQPLLPPLASFEVSPSDPQRAVERARAEVAESVTALVGKLTSFERVWHRAQAQVRRWSVPALAGGGAFLGWRLWAARRRATRAERAASRVARRR